MGDFLDTAQRIADGGSTSTRRSWPGSWPATGTPLDRLSERERRVLELMAEGLTNTGIAQRLVVSERTVEAHIPTFSSSSSP